MGLEGGGSGACADVEEDRHDYEREKLGWDGTVSLLIIYILRWLTPSFLFRRFKSP
jgi:hypothetical protein